MSPAAKREPLIRTCSVCGVLWDGPAYWWDAHLVRDGKAWRLVDTCSVECRKGGGFLERKVVR